MTTRAQLEGVMSLAADLMADGQAVAAERLLRLFASDQSVEPAPDPSTETLSAIERKRLRDREYAAKRRLVAKKSSVVVSESSDESSQKSSATSLSRAFSEEAEEEKRKLCDSRQFSAESESLSLPESSELRAREETTSRQKSSASVVASLPESSATVADVKSLAKVARRIQEVTATPFDIHSWRTELGILATKPPDEFERVLKGVKMAFTTDEWMQSHRALVTPKHILKCWARYLDPPKPSPLKRRGPAPLPDPSAYARDALNNPPELCDENYVPPAAKSA